MKIVLIGFMTTGKSTVAPLLASKLGMEAVEMDDLIVRKSGLRNIPEIFQNGGEPAFRALETAVAKDLEARDNAVISTGGGAVMSPVTMSSLTDGAIVVGLSAPFETLLKRISPKLPLPLFENAGQAKALYELRAPLYSKYATVRIETDNKSPDQVVEEIISKVGKP